MSQFMLRDATLDDIPFLVDTIIEAEKSGTDRLSYSTVFGLTEEESRKYITDMLMEEVDGCELSVSSFMLAEKDNQIAAAISSWVEGAEGIPSSVLKGNLLSYIIPRENLEKGARLSHLLREIHIENAPDVLQIGLVYVSPFFRGQNLVSLLINEKIRRTQALYPGINEAHIQVFSDNTAAVRAYEKAGFKIAVGKKSVSDEVIKYLPCNGKILMKKEFRPINSHYGTK